MFVSMIGGSRMITIYDIAEECGVSPATVSLVINMSPVVSSGPGIR